MFDCCCCYCWLWWCLSVCAFNSVCVAYDSLDSRITIDRFIQVTLDWPKTQNTWNNQQIWSTIHWQPITTIHKQPTTICRQCKSDEIASLLIFICSPLILLLVVEFFFPSFALLCRLFSTTNAFFRHLSRGNGKRPNHHKQPNIVVNGTLRYATTVITNILLDFSPDLLDNVRSSCIIGIVRMSLCLWTFRVNQESPKFSTSLIIINKLMSHGTLGK